MCILKLCAHYVLAGRACQAPAVRGSNYCRHHRRYHPEAANLPAYIFDVTDGLSMWTAMKRLIYDKIEGRVKMDPKTTYRCVWELRTFAARNLPEPSSS